MSELHDLLERAMKEAEVLMPDDMPMISSSTYTSLPLDVVNMGSTAGAAVFHVRGDDGPYGVRGDHGPPGDPGVDVERARRSLMMAEPRRMTGKPARGPTILEYQKEEAMASQRRLIQVVIVDPDENVPLEQCLLFHGTPKLTDATDQELFFEIEIKHLLDAHNEKRVKLVNKKVKERVEHLEPAKIRDLRMAVVEIARFY